MTSEHREELVATLLHQSYLFDDPVAYRAGVRDTVDALAASKEGPGIDAGERARTTA